MSYIGLQLKYRPTDFLNIPEENFTYTNAPKQFVYADVNSYLTESKF